jgi:hypothetical protein
MGQRRALNPARSAEPFGPLDDEHGAQRTRLDADHQASTLPHYLERHR